ncbi:heteropolysaccharide repeat-containing protein [Clostridium gelidum]|uniref:Heteropolysaccharide repeat-containing protein n=1 Tax=Clostridium gelidum TaxID=704125 RepID=A0ABM7TBT8_9CLOT|nr:oligosaccharide flippase family protein [Clostridium gelidum]BCZ49390.1 heteropolysaccharide repeat-containing protein [Clostridium gelidum]
MSKSISKNAIFKTVLNVFNIILPIIVMPVVLSAIQDKLNGYITMGEAWTAVFMIFASFGIYQYGLREVSRVRDDKNKLKQTITSLFIITTVTTTIISVLYAFFLIIFHRNDGYFYTCMVMGLNIVFNMFNVEWINEALENYDFIVIKTMIVKIIYNALTICFVRTQEDFLFYIYLTCGINFINNISSFIYIKKKIQFNFLDLQFKKHLKPMFSVVILANTYILYTWLDKNMINSYIGSTEAGYYGVAQKIMYMIDILMFTIVQVSMARLSNYLENHSKEVYLKLLNKIVKVYFLFLFPASIGLLGVSKQVIIIMGRGTDTYLPAVPILMVFSIYMLTIGVDRIIADQIIYIFGREKTDAKLVLIGGLLNLVLNTLLLITKTFTPTTVIATTLIANLVVIAMEYRLVKKEIKLDIHLFAFENLKYLYYSLIFIPITFAINKFIYGVILSCILDVIVCCSIYFIILIVTRDKVFFELLFIVLAKIKILYNKLKVI